MKPAKIHLLGAWALAAFSLYLDRPVAAQNTTCVVPVVPPLSGWPVHPACLPDRPACSTAKGGSSRAQIDTYNTALDVYDPEADGYVVQLNYDVSQAQAYSRCEVGVLNAQKG